MSEAADGEVHVNFPIGGNGFMPVADAKTHEASISDDELTISLADGRKVGSRPH
jgi:hypothetical protein